MFELDPVILSQKLEDLFYEDCDEKLASTCYEELIARKNAGPALSAVAIFKRIVDFTLRTYDLIASDETQQLLDTDKTPVTIYYQNRMPEFRDGYRFTLTIVALDLDSFMASLLRTRVLSGQHISKPSADTAIIDQEMIPTLVEENNETDVSSLMTLIGMLIHDFRKICGTYD